LNCSVSSLSADHHGNQRGRECTNHETTRRTVYHAAKASLTAANNPKSSTKPEGTQLASVTWFPSAHPHPPFAGGRILRDRRNKTRNARAPSPLGPNRLFNTLPWGWSSGSSARRNAICGQRRGVTRELTLWDRFRIPPCSGKGSAGNRCRSNSRAA